MPNINPSTTANPLMNQSRGTGRPNAPPPIPVPVQSRSASSSRRGTPVNSSRSSSITSSRATTTNGNPNTRIASKSRGTTSPASTSSNPVREGEWRKCQAARHKFENLVKNINKGRSNGKVLGPIQVRNATNLLSDIHQQCRLSNQNQFDATSQYYWGNLEDMMIQFGLRDWMDLQQSMINHEEKVDYERALEMVFNDNDDQSRVTHNNSDEPVLASADIVIDDNEKWRLNRNRDNRKRRKYHNNNPDRSRSRDRGDDIDRSRHVRDFTFWLFVSLSLFFPPFSIFQTCLRYLIFFYYLYYISIYLIISRDSTNFLILRNWFTDRNMQYVASSRA